MPLQHLDETAKLILDAASKRFLHYGYGKTTMSEIAGDCNMSTGNLYRYFPSKLDIAEAFVRLLRANHVERLKQAARKAETPQEKLRAVLQTKFRLAYERFHNRPKAYELSAALMRERPEFADEWESHEGEIISAVLEEGEAAGVFEPRDQRRLAKIIQDAVYRFGAPSVFHEGDYEILAAELDEVIEMILDAFAWRKAGCAG